MDPARWKRVEEIYQAASERKPEERAAFLAVACVGDGDLRRDVESLLAPPDAARPAIGQRLAHYEIQEKLGEGGMGLSTAPTTPNSAGRWRSRSCRRNTPPTPSGGRGCSAKPAPLRR